MQVARYASGERRIIKHLGSAHDPASLALLEARADELITQMLGAEQLAMELEGLNEAEQEARFSAGSAAGARTVGTSSGPLWHLLTGVYDQIFGTVIDSAVFRQLVIARIIEPTSKADSLRVIGQAGGRVPTFAADFVAALGSPRGRGLEGRCLPGCLPVCRRSQRGVSGRVVRRDHSIFRD